MDGYRILSLWMILFLQASLSFSQTERIPLVLQELSWPDVAVYLESNDMIIIPLGSTEQHGPHLPLGSDYFEAYEMAKEISRKTGVIVAPVISVGYSKYHEGFPGTISLKPETIEQVIFDSVSSLMKHGFRRFMFFNYHGGNNVIQESVIHRINHTTEAIAIAIGHGSAFQSKVDGEFFDWHAGKFETSLMLYVRPDLVRMKRAEKPDIRFTSQMEELKALAEETPELMHVWEGLFGVPCETGKGGASHELSSNGIWSLSDPRSATKELGERNFLQLTETAVRFIEAWKLSSGSKLKTE